MSEFCPLLRLLVTPRAGDHAVALRHAVPVSHGDWEQRVRCWHTALLAQPGKLLALYHGDSVEFAAILLAAWHAGKTVYLPSDPLPATCAALQADVDFFVGEFPASCQPLAAPGQDGSDGAWTALDPDFIGLVVYTSGSTGAPQAIPKKLGQLAAEVATLEQLFGAKAGRADVVGTVSHQHIYGLLFRVLWPLAAGRCFDAHAAVYPEQLVQSTTARDCILVTSPAHLKRLPESAAWRHAAHRIRIVFSSGGPLPPDVAQGTRQDLGEAPVEVYGSSETGGVAWRQRQQAGEDDGWCPLPGVSVRTDESQLLEIRSPHLPDEQWFCMADRVGIHSDGRFSLLGRADRIVKIEEKRISLDQMETQLIGSPLVRGTRILVLDGARQQVAAFVILSEEGRALLDAEGKHALNQRLRAHLALAIERIALPRRWRYLDKWPENTQGKTTYAALRALLEPEPERVLQPELTLVESDAGRARYALLAPPELAYFDGHFPQTPILPGVAQIEWALRLAKARFALPPVFRGIQALKFQRVIRPDVPFSLELDHDAAKGCVTFRYASDEGVHASGRLLFGAADV